MTGLFQEKFAMGNTDDKFKKKGIGNPMKFKRVAQQGFFLGGGGVRQA